jgi:hypothetical protein
MTDAKRMTDEANRMGQQAQERMQSGFEAASRLLQLIGVRSLEQAMQIQSDYAKRVYENHMAELKKLGEMTVGIMRETSKPAEDASRRSR